MKDYERLTKRGKYSTGIYVEKMNGEKEWQDAFDLVENERSGRIDEVFDRLAELEDKIEQGTIKEEKTCKNVSEMHPVDGFTCSECGISLVDYVEERVDEEEYDTTYHEYEIKYCPNCGAKVVEE